MTWNEDTIEQAALEWLEGLGYEVINGIEIQPEGEKEERKGFEEVILKDRFSERVHALNPDIPQEAIEDAIQQVLVIDGATLTIKNKIFHKMLRDGVNVEYRDNNGRVVGDTVSLIDYENPKNNNWAAVNQFTVIESGNNRRPDIIIFVNGIPLSVIELKNLGNEDATIESAYMQLQTYKDQIPSLFDYNALLVISDGVKAEVGSLTANIEWFKPWKTITGEEFEPQGMLELEVLLKGIFEKERFLSLIHI